MKKFFYLCAVITAFMVLTAGVPFRKAVQDDPYNAVGNHHPYIVPEFTDTKAPCGYKPFYVSHYGRHGSRFLTSDSGLRKQIKTLGKLEDLGLLTSEGIALKNELIAMKAEQEGQDGILTQVGSREHQGISRRLYKRVKRVFGQKNRREVFVQCSPVHRCLQSAANFLGELKANSPELDVELHSGDRYFDVLAHDADGPVKDSLDKIRSRIADSMIVATFGPDSGKKIFKDIPAVEEALGGKSVKKLVYDLIYNSSIARCLDIDIDPISHFTEDDMYAFGMVFCAKNRVSFARAKETGLLRDTVIGKPLLADFILKADEALKSDSHKCADLRFGHDTGVGPLLSLLRVEGYDNTPAMKDVADVWVSANYICMGTNCQMIFYRNRKGDVLVKILRNEIETVIPSLPTFKGPYYRWEDLRAYCASLCGIE